MKIYLRIIFAIIYLILYVQSLGTKTTVLEPETKPEGLWQTKQQWSAYWVKHWEIRKIWVPVWKKVWAPVQTRQWVPFPKPKPTGWKPPHH